ncbi:hypothetical protein IFM89_037741 [Coptis chinensis]|uniref:Uncharacterized protein n=1 Tax=Coptis chinensis TaxID=261450 RepID=A0A835ISQ1_9MAGN|nr:hypothetical protein IFM89_037741 [Coptis chinensis]
MLIQSYPRLIMEPGKSANAGKGNSWANSPRELSQAISEFGEASNEQADNKKAAQSGRNGEAWDGICQ